MENNSEKTYNVDILLVFSDNFVIDCEQHKPWNEPAGSGASGVLVAHF